ncbi:M48 family metallopeptidase [Steroidobacter sp.]|uniref:M48 family metallopeptidase n=1 Tax=Steroidobacter sp. TaxID=1978227 RepID=UPI001A43F3C3|nr:M48 family metalloprotease [Steroidobacter sp.]MBL8271031.1 M48 family metalloprotease [Steroidobacter sp.]
MTAEHVYPAGPSSVPADLTKSTQTYRLHAWLAMGGLALFVALYLGLTAWFSWTAYRLFLGATHGGEPLWSAVGGACAAFLAIFMCKALFFVQHRHQIDDIEVTAQEQPRLFAFINRLADEAGAPRAHRVFLSPRVNAAVFYDLTVLNLLFPSRKNLEIGLALVNTLTLGELKAVLAHEFGHFAQRSMAVGRWVYIAQQIAAHIISKRDALDSFLRGLSRFDVRIAWVGWLLSLIIWSIRSMMETVFRLVLLAQRALSREMELQADLVAVSLTGSDALIHALHKLGAADEAWSRAVAFADSEVREKRRVVDLFAVQRHVTTKLREVLDNPAYGDIDPLPATSPEQHRVFKSSLGQPPRMWSTHPENSERELNAKRTYIAAAIDDRSAWELFDDVSALKERMTAHVFRSITDAQAVPVEESLAKLDEKFNRAYYDRSYRGAYLGRPLTNHSQSAGELYGPVLRDEHILAELEAIYPESLAAELQQLRSLEEEYEALRALQEGFLTAPGGIIRHRGKELRRADLQQAIEDCKEELDRVRTAVLGHDKRCRSVHLSAAKQLGNGWEDYLKGLLALLHYAEHNDANLQDAYGAMRNVLNIVTADGRVSDGERRRLIHACADVHNALRHIYEDEGRLIQLDRTVLRRLKVDSWQAALGDFNLPPADQNNLGDWLQAIDSWVGSAAAALSALRQASLEQLLLVEGQVARFVRTKLQPGAAPEPSVVPNQYPVFVPGSERPRQKKLDLWDRFHVADGLVPTLARLTVACGIIAAVLSVGTTVGTVVNTTIVNIYNGLGRPVKVAVGADEVRLRPFSHAKLPLLDQEHYVIKTTAITGELIEEFQVDIPSGSNDNVYNVAGASLLMEWTAVYGNVTAPAERVVGPMRWTTSDASFIFEEPPSQLSTRRSSSGDTRTVLSAYGAEHPTPLFQWVKDQKQLHDVTAMHVIWDSSDAQYTAFWLSAASGMSDFDELLRARLALQPNDMLTLRAEQDFAREGRRLEVCERHRSLASGQPSNFDLKYLTARCLEGDAERDRAFAELYAQAPTNGWLAFAVAYSHLQQAHWQEALAPLDVALQSVPPSMGERIAMDTLRVRRMLSDTGKAALGGLEQHSRALSYFDSLESGAGVQPGNDRAYYHLGRGAPALAMQELERDQAPDPRIVRFAAASDGAKADLIAKALALPITEGIDPDTVLVSLALAWRERADAEPYLASFRAEPTPDAQRVLEFMSLVRQGDVARAEQQLDDIDIKLRARAYSAALVLLGERAPKEWRVAANRLLFVPERPYFAAANTGLKTQ